MQNVSIFLAMFLFNHLLFAQCSDAGVCSLHDRARKTEVSSLQHNIGVNYIFGRSSSADDITYHTARIDGSFSIMEEARVFLTIPFNAQSGPLGDASGIGDVIILWSHTVLTNNEYAISMQLGGKFATGNANGNPALPQQYQTGLGSNDILLGVTVNYNGWDVTIGYQEAGKRSSNRITRLQRSDDVLLRAGYTFSEENVSVHPSLLFIQRLNNSSVVNTAFPAGPEFIELPDSAPSQFNLLMEGEYTLSTQYSLTAAAAFPFLKRKTNVDGLTRAVTLSLGMNFNF